VPSTLSEALLLEHMLALSTDPVERIVLLQHAIDNITGTFYTQVLFADFELRAHRLAEQDQPITAEILTETYTRLLQDYYGDALDLNAQTGLTWARIPHFFNSPYYVYQYATCFASAARLAREIMDGTEGDRREARERYLTLLRSGGNDYPMEQLKKAGVDLSQPDTVRAVVDQLDDLVTRLEQELEKAPVPLRHLSP
jgi:oligoendopeptidase F